VGRFGRGTTRVGDRREAARSRDRVRERCRPRFAATAELAGLTVLHNDKDFELIAAITDQPTEQLDLP
jgi:predicted nucleic acid-binding protein